MNTRLIRHQLRKSNSQYRVLILGMADEIDKLRRSESLLQRRLAIAQSAAHIYRADLRATPQRRVA